MQKLAATPPALGAALWDLKRKKERGPEMKVSGDLGEIKNKSPGASGLTLLAVEDFEVLGHTVNCQSWD